MSCLRHLVDVMRGLRHLVDVMRGLRHPEDVMRGLHHPVDVMRFLYLHPEATMTPHQYVGGSTMFLQVLVNYFHLMLIRRCSLSFTWTMR